MTELTREELERLSDLHAKATPGPWRLKTSGNFGNLIEAYSGKRSELLPDDGMRTVASYQYCGPSDRYDERVATTAATGELIVAAVNALPALLQLAQRVMDAPEFKMELVRDETGQCVAARFCTRSEKGQRVALVPVPTKGE